MFNLRSSSVFSILHLGFAQHQSNLWDWECLASKHAGSDSEVLWLCPGYCSQHAARIGPDQICRIQLPGSNSVPFLQKRPRSYCAKLAWIQSGWPGQVWAKQMWSRSKLVHRSHQAPSQLHSCTDSTHHTVQNQPRSGLVQADCVRFWPNWSSP